MSEEREGKRRGKGSKSIFIWTPAGQRGRALVGVETVAADVATPSSKNLTEKVLEKALPLLLPRMIRLTRYHKEHFRCCFLARSYWYNSGKSIAVAAQLMGLGKCQVR